LNFGMRLRFDSQLAFMPERKSNTRKINRKVALCDRATTTCNLLDFNGADSPFLLL
jgi:hypothetical protein